MADRKWQRLIPVWQDAVPLLAGVIGGRLLDCLLSKHLLTYDQYDELDSLRREKAANDEVARALLRILRKKPYPSFDNFWTVLDTVDGGGDVRRQLLERRDTPPTRRRRTTEGFGTDAEIGDGSDRRQTTLSSSSQTATAAAVALPTNFPVPQPRLDAKGVDESRQAEARHELVLIEVVRYLKDMFKLHQSTLKEVVQEYLENAYLGKRIKLKVIFPAELKRKQRSFSIDTKPKVRILFPDRNSACFETDHEMIKTHLCRIMDLKESDLEIDVTEGSITLIILLPGQGLINMLVYLGQNAEPLEFLLDVDKSAKISFGDLPYIPVSVFSRNCSPRAASKRVARVFPTVKQQQKSECHLLLGDDERFCQLCDPLGERKKAEFVCIDCKDYQYYCRDCAQSVHEKSKRKQHAYWNLLAESKNIEKQTRARIETCLVNHSLFIGSWRQPQGDDVSKTAFYSFMVGNPSPSAMESSAVVNLENLLDDENDEMFLEGSVALGRCTVERLRQAVKDNKEKRTGLMTSLLPFLIDSLIRRERLIMFTKLFCFYREKHCDGDVPEMVLDLTAKDVAIALLETVSDNTKLFVMKCLDIMGYPLPVCYVMKQATQPSTCIANFGALSSVLPSSTSPLVMSCGTFNTVRMGKTFLLKELIARLSSSIDIDLLDDGNGPTHDPSIDLILEKKGKGAFNYADIHGWNADLNFSNVVATLASVSYLILLHVSEDDVKDLKSKKPTSVRFLLKEQLRSTPAVLVVLIRDTEDEGLRVEAETEFRNAFSSCRKVISILVKNLKLAKGARLDRDIKTVSQRLEDIFEAQEDIKLRSEKLKFPPSEYLAQRYRAQYHYLASPFLRLRTSLGEELFKALKSTYKKNKDIFSKLFPITTIKSKIARTHATEKDIIEGFAKNKSKHEIHIKECKKGRQQLKNERVQIADVAKPLKLFADMIISKDAKRFAEFQHYLEEWKSRHVEGLHRTCQCLHNEIKQLRLQKSSGETSDKILQAEKKYQQNSSALDEIDFSVDSFWSEIMHMYNLEAKKKSKQLTASCLLAPATAKEVYLDYLKQGFAMQLLQGKPLQMAGQFMRDVLSELDRQESSEEEKDLFVVSVIGEQSSGKSTLLNSLFGCGFSTAAGKCTKGLFASYLKLSTNKSLLVLDSEGLLSVEGGGRVFDGQIALLALACSDLVIINHKGEISSELNDLLQVCLYAMDTLKVAKIKPNVAFVLRDQRECRDERVHQTALLKMQEALQKAIRTSSKDVDDLIEIGSDSLFLLHSAFSETCHDTRSIEIPSLKFARETFRLRKKIIQLMEKGNFVHTELKNGSTSRPLSDWYAHASYVWKTITKHGHSLLYCKTVREIRLRQELGDIANEVVKKELSDESQGFIMLARAAFNHFFKILKSAETEEDVNIVGRDFNRKLEAIMEAAIKGLQDHFDQMTRGKQYQEFKDSFKNPLGVPVKHEYDFQRENWKIKEDHRKKELYLKHTSRFFLERSKELLESTKYQRGISTEEAEALFREQWDEFEPKAMARLEVKKTVEEIEAEVHELFFQVAANTKYKVAGRSAVVTIPQKKLFSEQQSDLFLKGEAWDSKYLTVRKTLGHYLFSSERFVRGNLKTIQAKVKNVMSDFKFSLGEFCPQPFCYGLVKKTVDEAVSVAERAEESFSSKGFCRFLTTQFVTDFVITLINESVRFMRTQQTRNEEKAREKLLEDKEDQRRYFLAVVSEDKTDLDKAKAVAKLYEKGIDLLIDSKLDEIKVTLRESVKNVFGHDHKVTTSRAYNESFGERNFENVVMYCIDADRFLYTMYSNRFEAEQSKVKRNEGEELIREVDSAYAQLIQACQSWQNEVTKSSKWLNSPESPKQVVKISDFEKWLKETSDISENCFRIFPELGDYKISRADVFCPKLGQELREIKKTVVRLLESEKVSETLTRQKRNLWLTQLKGCPRVCPKCGVKCERENSHPGSHAVRSKFHVFPSFHQWAIVKGGTEYVHLTMCLDPEIRNRRHTRGSKEWNGLEDFLKDEYPDWLPFPSDPDFAKPRSEIKEAWVNCRKALIYLRNPDPEARLVDNTPQDWIEAYEIKEKLVTEDDVEKLKRKLQEETDA